MGLVQFIVAAAVSLITGSIVYFFSDNFNAAFTTTAFIATFIILKWDMVEMINGFNESLDKFTEQIRRSLNEND